eukprot:g37908.t1
MLVFVQRRHDAEWLDQQFRAADFQVSFTHGEMDAKLREDRFEDFKQGRSTVLITTNLFSRGIDISAITMVVNYDLPLKFKNRMQMQQDPRPEPDFDTFLHRVGRTARYQPGYPVHFGCAWRSEPGIAVHFGCPWRSEPGIVVHFGCPWRSEPGIPVHFGCHGDLNLVLRCILAAHEDLNRVLRCILAAHEDLNRVLRCILAAHGDLNRVLRCILAAHGDLNRNQHKFPGMGDIPGDFQVHGFYLWCHDREKFQVAWFDVWCYDSGKFQVAWFDCVWCVMATGNYRAGLSGIAIHFVDSEMNMQILKQIRERFALHMTELSFSHDPLQQQKLRSVVDKAFKQLKKKSDAQLAAEAEHGKAILQKEKARHDSEDRNKAALPESSAVPHRPPQNLPPPSSSSSSSSTSTLSSSPFGDTSAFGDGSSAFDEPIPNGDAVAGWREGGGDGDDVPDTGNADSGNAFGLEAGSGDGGGFGNFDFGSSEHGQEQGNSVGGLDDEDLGKGFGSMGIGGDKGDPISNWAAGFDNTAGSSDENVGGAVDFGDFAASFNADAFSSSQDFGNAGFDFAAELAGGGDSSKPES